MTIIRFLCILTFFLFTIADLALGIFTLKKRDDDSGRFLGLVMIFSSCVIFFYCLSMLIPSYRTASAASSLYFASVVLMLNALVNYAQAFTQLKPHSSSLLKWPLTLLTAADLFCLFINPFREFVISYVYTPDAVAVWQYQPHLFYYFHLALSYSCILIFLFIFLQKIIRVPRIYHGHYVNVLLGIFVIVALNAVFLFIPLNLFDFSLLFYSLMCFFLYWNHYHYARKGMLSACRTMLLNDLGLPILLFDNEDLIVLSNKEAKLLFGADTLKKDLPMKDFLEKYHLKRILSYGTDIHSFQWSEQISGRLRSYRCDYRPLLDNSGRILGKCLVFTENSSVYDLLTGFNTISRFENDFSSEIHPDYPVSVTVFDIKRLSLINQRLGRIHGDSIIQLLSNLMRESFPENTYFTRLTDANLLAVSPSMNQETARTIAASIENRLNANTDFDLSISAEYSVRTVQDSSISIPAAAAEVLNALRSKKLLDRNTSHSSLLDSMIQMQQESDSTTEEHVKRTHLAGKRLGERLGLSDNELTELGLLCILHDIGKVGIPLNILNKPGKLNEEEWAVMQTHVERGYRIAIASEELQSIGNYILHHHEAWNGKGYPDGLKAESIPLLSRIISVIDAYDAMTNDRPYRKALPPEDARKELLHCAGTQFDPVIVMEYLKLLEEEEKEASPLTPSAPDNLVPADNLRPKAEKLLSEKTEENHNSISCVNYTHYYLDHHGLICQIDSSFSSLTGYTEEDVKELKLSQASLIFEEELADYITETRKSQANGEDIYIEHRLRRKDGSAAYVLCFGRNVSLPDHPEAAVEIVAADITETKAARTALEKERLSSKRALDFVRKTARLDSLTALPNREAFKNDTQLKMMQGKRCLMMMMDLDNFKQYNDTYGHFAGDTLLKVFGSALRSKQEAGHCYVGRMGGDEFSLSAFAENDCSDEELENRIREIYRFLSEAICSVTPVVTLSAGVYIGDGSMTFNELYRASDQALYEIKRRQKGQIVFHSNRNP